MLPIYDSTIVDAAVATARRWATASTTGKESLATKLLSDALHAPGGLEFTLDFVDHVIRPEDNAVAARQLAKLSRRNADFLPAWLKFGFKGAGLVSRVLPPAVMPMVRRAFAELVGDLVVDVHGNSLGKVISKIRADGTRLNINLLGEAVLGDAHAQRRLTETRRLLARDDVDYVSLKVSAVVGPHAPFAFEQTVAHAIDQLRPLYQYALEHGKFINLDMEEYKDLHLTREVFTRLLDEPELLGLSAGIVVQCYLPDALGELSKLQAWAAARVQRGGAPIKVRLVKGANMAMENVSATMHGWPSPILPSKMATDANYLRALDYCLQPERIANVRVGAASHNLFTLASAWELAKARVVTDGLELEMLSGMATSQAAAVKRDVGSLLLYLPVVDRDEYDAAISYLVRRLEENAADENFMSRISTIGESDSFEVEAARYQAAIALLEREGLEPLRPNRSQDRRQTPEPVTGPFDNTPDTDPALLENQEWAAEIIAQLPCPTLGQDTVEDSIIHDEIGISEVIERGIKAGEQWREKPLEERIALLRKVADELEKDRGKLLQVAADEVGKTLDQADVEVSEACDFARYYPECARELDKLEGVSFTPAKLTAVIPPWNFPLAIPLGGVMAALAAGSAVVLKPARASRRCGAILAEAIWRAGISPDVMQFICIDDSKLGQQLITDEKVERVVLTGSADTAGRFLQWRPDLRLMAETSGKNAIIVTPSADIDLAVADVVTSAFGHAGQKCSAGSLVILVGSVAKSRRFLDQLADAVSSLTVDWPSNPASQMSPLTEVPGEKLLRGLTTLEPGQRWIFKPASLDDTGRLYSPGVREHVEPNSEYHLTEYFGPILGIMAAKDLNEAIEWQNGTEFGLTAGIHSLDEEEITTWCEKIAAGNCYVNRTITGAIVRRQPFGGWKRSVVGAGTKAGGPNYLFGFGDFKDAGFTRNMPAITIPALRDLLTLARELPAETSPNDKDSDAAQAAPAKLLSSEDLTWLTNAATSDEEALRAEFGKLHDPSNLGVEINVLRYRPSAITIRVENQPARVLLRELSAALTSQVPLDEIRISVDDAPKGIIEWCKDHDITIVKESDISFDAWLTAHDWKHDGRIRFIGERTLSLGSIDVAVFDWPSLSDGRIALLPYVKEQSVTITNHRFGNPTRLHVDLG